MYTDRVNYCCKCAECCEWYREQEEATTPSNPSEQVFSDNRHQHNGDFKDG